MAPGILKTAISALMKTDHTENGRVGGGRRHSTNQKKKEILVASCSRSGT